MDLRAYDDLEPDAVAWLNRVGLGYDMSPALVRKVRRVDSRVPQEFAWYACEEGRPVSQVGYLLYPVRTEAGEDVAGVPLAVCTLPVASRRGYATQLLEHVHDRLREQGARYSFLTTSRTRVAHALYEGIGYRDVVRFRQAFGRMPGRRTDTYRVRGAKGQDEAAFHVAFEARVRGSLGFVVRPRNFVAARRAWGDLPQRNLRTLLHDECVVGYGWRRRGPPVDILELVATEGDALFWIPYLTGQSEFSFLLSPRDREPAFLRAGLSITDSWSVLMATDLTRRPSLRRLREELGLSDGRFEALALDLY